MQEGKQAYYTYRYQHLLLEIQNKNHYTHSSCRAFKDPELFLFNNLVQFRHKFILNRIRCERKVKFIWHICTICFNFTYYTFHIYTNNGLCVLVLVSGFRANFFPLVMFTFIINLTHHRWQHLNAREKFKIICSHIQKNIFLK